MNVKTLPEVLVRLGMPMQKQALAELILWAFENVEERADAITWIKIPTNGI